jgi:hypothetical protein
VLFLHSIENIHIISIDGSGNGITMMMMKKKNGKRNFITIKDIKGSKRKHQRDFHCNGVDIME